jgi:hypothetical protein
MGSIIAGYRIDGLISRGGMGMVYRATNVALNRRYALKVIAPELADDDEFRERFKREIRIAAALAPSQRRRDSLCGRAGGNALPGDGLRGWHRPEGADHA